jgi:hypothetical protein
MNDDTCTLVGFAITVIAVMCCIMVGCHETEATKRAEVREAMKAGLVQKQEVNSTVTVWARP